MKTIVNRIKDSAISSELLQHSYQFLVGALGALVILFFFHLIEGHQKPRIGTVNITALIDQFVKAQAGQRLSQAEQQQRVKAFGQLLEKTLQDVAVKNQVVLMPSEAVIAGSRDFTPQLQQRLKALK